MTQFDSIRERLPEEHPDYVQQWTTLPYEEVVIDDNAHYGLLCDLRSYRGVHVFRDPRDFAISSYFSHLKSHHLFLSLESHRKLLEQLPFEEGVLEDIRWTEQVIGYLTALRNWELSDSNILNLQFEQVIEDPFSAFSNVLDFLELPVDKECLRRVLAEWCFETMSGGRSRGTERTGHHYRNGISCDWKRYFTPRLLDFFEKEYGDLLEKFQYR